MPCKTCWQILLAAQGVFRSRNFIFLTSLEFPQTNLWTMSGRCTISVFFFFGMYLLCFFIFQIHVSVFGCPTHVWARPTSTSIQCILAGLTTGLLARGQCCLAPNSKAQYSQDQTRWTCHKAMVELGLLLQSRGDPGAVEYFRKAALNQNVSLDHIWASKLWSYYMLLERMSSQHSQPDAFNHTRRGFALLADVFERGAKEVCRRLFKLRKNTSHMVWLFSDTCCRRALLVEGELGIPKNLDEAAKLRNFGHSPSDQEELAAAKEFSRCMQVTSVWFVLLVKVRCWKRRLVEVPWYFGGSLYSARMHQQTLQKKDEWWWQHENELFTIITWPNDDQVTFVAVAWVHMFWVDFVLHMD